MQVIRILALKKIFSGAMYIASIIICSLVFNVSGVDADELCYPSDPLAGQAYVYLCADSLDVGWSESIGWQNIGTASGVLEPNFDNETNNLEPSKAAPYYSTEFSSVASLVVPRNDELNVDGSYYDNSYGFYIPANSMLDIPNSGGRTFVFDVTPLRIDERSSSKLVWKYSLANLPDSGSGWVIEKVLDIPIAGPVVAAAYDGESFAADLATTIISGRQTIVLRIDRNEGTFNQFRNGLQITSATPSNQNISTFGSAVSASDLLFGPGWALHNVLMFDRALTGEEIAHLNDLLTSDNAVIADAQKPGVAVEKLAATGSNVILAAYILACMLMLGGLMSVFWSFSS